MDMTNDEHVRAFKMLASGASFEEIAMAIFPEAYADVPELTVELLRGTMHAWYRRQPTDYLIRLMEEVS